MLIFGEIRPRNGPGEPRWAPGEILKIIEKVQGDIYQALRGVFYQFIVSEPDIYGEMC